MSTAAPLGLDTSDSLLTLAVIGKLVLGLVFVLSILFLLIVLMRFLQRKKISFTGRQGGVRVLQTYYAGSKQKLTVVQWEDTQYLLAFTANGGFLVDKKVGQKTDSKKDAPKQ